MPPDNFEVDYFVSRRGTHAAVAQEVAQVLMAAGHTVKVQDYDIPHGANFVAEMHDALVRCRHFIALLSADYDDAPFTGAEWTNFYADAAQSNGKRRFVIIRIEDFEPRGLFRGIVRGDLVGVSDVHDRQQRILAAAEGRSLANPLLPWLFDNVPPRLNDFTGRDTRLAELHKLFMQAKTPAAITQAALYGLGGIGKTSLAIEYAHVYGSDYAGVWWAGAETRTQLIANLAALAGKLDRRLAEERDQEAAAREGLNRLARATKPYLLVYDNVETPDILGGLLPATGARVLITTRYAEWGGIAKEVKLDVLAPPDAEAFLQKRAGRTDAPGARALAGALGYLPLALDHAGAYCRLTALTFDAYRKKVDSLISKAPRSTTHESVGATFELAIEKAASDGSGAEELLGALAFLAPERIGLELIDDSILSVDNRAEALGSLAAVSLVEHLTLDKDMPVITLHRLVQAAMRRRLADKNKTATTVAQVTRGLREAFPAHAYQETKYWPRCAELLPHVLALRELALWDDLSKIAAAGLLNRAASYLHGRASYTQPEAFFREAIKFVDAAQDTEEDKAIYQNNLATLLTDTGRFAEAEPLFREAIKLGENTIGREHPEIATRLVNLGRVLQLSGRPKEAEPLYREAIAIDEKTYGREHPEVATDLNVLADMLVELGRHDDAEPLLREGLAIRHKLLGRDHWYTAISERCLGKLLLATGREDEAIPHVERALEISARIAGPEHPRSKAAARTYARALGAVGRSEEAASVMAHYQVSED